MLGLSEKFLLECIRADGENNLNNVFKSFLPESHKIDWRLVSRTVPYIYLKAKNFHKDFNIPKEIQQEIQQVYFWQTARNEKIMREMLELASEFNLAKIDLIFLKGLALLNTIYNSQEDLRLMKDVDVLIREKDLYRAEKILKNLNYQTEETDEKRKIYLAEHFHFQYYSKEKLYFLELHWDIGEQWLWDIVKLKNLYKDILFKSSEEVKLKDAKIKTLSPAGNIFISCFNFERDLSAEKRIVYLPFIHLSKYRKEKEELVCRSLRFFYEIKKMLEYYGARIKWDELFSLAKATRKEYEIFTLLFLLKKSAKADIQKTVLKKIKKNIFVRLYIFLCHFISYDNLTALLFLNKIIYPLMLVCSYIYKRKFYLLGLRIKGGRI